MPSAADEVVDLLRGDECLELLERRGRVGAVEPADGHHGRLGRELVAGGVVGADGGGDPGVGAGVLLQQGGELGAGGRASRAGPPGPPRRHRAPVPSAWAVARVPVWAVVPERSPGRRTRPGRDRRRAYRRRAAHPGRASRRRPPARPTGSRRCAGSRRWPARTRSSPARAGHQGDASRRRRPRPAAAGARPAAPPPRPSPAIGTAHASQGCQVGVRRAGTNAQPTVTATTAASVARAAEPPPGRRHSATTPEPDERADRRRQRHRVVRVDDPGHEAEHQAGDQQPAAPQHGGGAQRGRCAGPDACDQSSTPSSTSAAGSSHDASARRSRSRTAGVMPVSPQPPPGAAADAAGLVAGQPAEAVVAEHELQHAVGLRAADVRARVGAATARPRAPTSRR